MNLISIEWIGDKAIYYWNSRLGLYSLGFIANYLFKFLWGRLLVTSNENFLYISIYLNLL